ncbi:hypothetical protein [Lacihabitans lacunae]|jgi:hypothetical protein|uniref:Uncharacterized protein n=1 Tax=Lacihabitans lacunae TaxID=1028214 RepID=A0ABV7YWS0_9BACT
MPPPHSAIATYGGVGLSAPAFVSGQKPGPKELRDDPSCGVEEDQKLLEYKTKLKILPAILTLSSDDL